LPRGSAASRSDGSAFLDTVPADGPRGAEFLVAAPAPAESRDKAGRVSVRVVSTEYAKSGGRLERAIAWITDLVTRDRVALLYEEDGQFEIALPPGRYQLSFTGNGSLGATFQPTAKEITIERPSDSIDLGTVDLPLTTTSRLFGKPAPELDGIVAWKHTEPIRLADLRGKVVVLDFWGWYCTICHQHKPDLARLSAEFGGKGLQVVAVHDGSLKSIEELNEHLEDIAKRYWGGKDLGLPIALDGSGDDSVLRTYGITAVPAVILIDQEGRVVRRFHHAGVPELKAEIERLLE
jgi:thiol-disulfide isomerase/thioredoxin